jgi:hypothetical protein
MKLNERESYMRIRTDACCEQSKEERDLLFDYSPLFYSGISSAKNIE